MIDAQDYAEFSRFLADCCGLVLGENRQYLVSSRLSRLLDEFAFAKVEDLLRALRRSADPTLKSRVIDAMTTNETSWFRDNYPFEILRQTVLPELLAKSRPIRIWSAACSSGQEPYSIAMVIAEWEATHPMKANVNILATDLSEGVLAQARSGLYDGLSIVRGLTPERRQRFFETVSNGHRIKPEIQQRVRFQKLNLMDSYAALGKFEIVFCRNVLIYFSADTKRRIFDGIARQMDSGGYLFVGASEAVGSYTDAFEILRTPQGSMLRRR
ncbi:CheR family methyltransferase [Chromatium okenii]|uniref:Chemotaxis protein methyltransferase n=1 Tax=Chromatium okenii TaxID=61644 RepID=A0A2S7XPC2_9GAMM|nr:protein-glutamate O-methyltransferase CheR [Chromatium okenii]MBV5308609.1 protein-glutamate O-methyltransferase CheR [Chromatium okenii]PQJ95272.1 chemotaxis protein [Chromatium okenii]